MADFVPAFDFLMSHEDPQRKYALIIDNNDAETISGINSAFYKDAVDRIKAIPQEQRGGAVATFYHNLFWIPNFSRITSQDVASKIFDMSVDMGLKEGATIAQRAANAVHFPTPGIALDGVFGSDTLFSINAAPEARLLSSLCSETEQFYRDLAAERPDLAPGHTLDVWLARAADLPNAGSRLGQSATTQTGS